VPGGLKHDGGRREDAAGDGTTRVVAGLAGGGRPGTGGAHGAAGGYSVVVMRAGAAAVAVSTRLGPRVTGRLPRQVTGVAVQPPRRSCCGQPTRARPILDRSAGSGAPPTPLAAAPLAVQQAGSVHMHDVERGREPAGNCRAGDDVAHPAVSPKASWTPTMAATWSASACGPRRCSTRSPRPALTRGSSSCARAEVSSSRMLATNCPPPAAREAATSTTQPVDIASQASWRPGLSARPRAQTGRSDPRAPSRRSVPGLS